ncbi:NlpC/P60 family protein [Mucilaginibacter sp.]|uniref:C40 family peptidase n=1 Tax=Mucilaginibacter sp. TaxID=1882438 RepID=UPI0025F72D25|nr:NlpC/P60 family protein [Mucilaginibacter sp.]
MRFRKWYYIIAAVLSSCQLVGKHGDNLDTSMVHNHILLAPADSAGYVTCITTGNITPNQLLAYADSLKGIPYSTASTDPKYGLDCSGFVACVFNHFHIAVPRSSVDYTFMHRQIPLKDAKPGDLILFTGTDSTERVVGHMGIVTSAAGSAVKFIHSTSGKNKGVVETAMDGYYLSRYIKTISIFPQNGK